MPRPLDINGRPMKAAHERLPNADRLRTVALFKMAEDSRFSFLTLARKIALANRAIDHVYDGTLPPASIYKPDPTDPDQKAMASLWRAITLAIQAEKRA